MSDLKVSLVLSAVDRASPQVKRLAGELERLKATPVGRGLATINAGINSLAVKAGAAAVAVGSIGATMTAALGHQVIATSAQFERFAAVLATTEGSAAKAQQALKWAEEFAVKTPYDLATVTEAYVKMRAYGLEPTAGLLKTLGNTAAAMDKPLLQAVEAIADAVTGENERLKEFGIKAKVAGNTITYEYTKAGKTMTATAQANSRAMIQATLAGIFNAQYAGAMDRLSETWGGKLSNIRDHWDKFLRKIGDAGAFGAAKDEAGGLLQTLDTMEANGTLDRLATVIGAGLGGGLREAADGFRALVASTGGIESWANGIGAAIGAVGDAARWAGTMVRSLKEPVTVREGGLLDSVGKAATQGWNAYQSIGETVRSGLGLSGQPAAPDPAAGALRQQWHDNLKRTFNLGGDGASALGGGSALDRLGSVARPQKVEGEVVIRIEGAPRGSKIEKVKARGGIELGVELGLSMGG